MLNLVQSDLYKLRKSKYLIVCLLLHLALSAGTACLLDYGRRMSVSGSHSIQLSQNPSANSGLIPVNDKFPENYEELSASSQILSFFLRENTILPAIVISLFAGGEFTYGTIRNLASRGYSRSRIYASKFIVSMLVSILFAVLHALAVTAVCLLNYGAVSPGFSKIIISGTVLVLLLNTALAAIFLMFSMLIRQSGGSLAVNICFPELLSLLAITGGLLPEEPTPGLFFRVITVCSLSLVLSTAIGASSFARRDIH